MADELISLAEARGKMRRLRDKSTQWKRSSYREGWNDAVDQADRALGLCRTMDVQPVVRCRDCLHAIDRQSTMVFCTVTNKHKDMEDYCNFGVYVEE